MNVDIEILRNEVYKLDAQNIKLRHQLEIAVQGLKALTSGGEQTGIANKTLEEIQKLDLPQEGIEAKE
tara:strand:- start:100 stop:303 length:204 start_codon:yes stop_codon:yes gene_type:complete